MLGSLRNYELPSKHLSPPRGVTCYSELAGPQTAAPVVVLCFDGQAVPTLGQSVQQFSPRTFPPCVLIGVHSDPQLRSKEYIAGNNTDIFEAHEAFVIDELIPWACREYSLKLERRRTAVWGCSNGGTLAMTMSTAYPEVFSCIFAFSVAGGMEYISRDALAAVEDTSYYLAAGNRETPFKKNNQAIAAFLREHSIPHECVIRPNRGHELSFWSEEFPVALEWAFGSK